MLHQLPVASAATRSTPRRLAGRKVARLGVLLALAVTLYIFESLLPALPIPGAKLGLANLVSLLAVLVWGGREAMMLVVARQLLGSLATGTFLSTTFYFGLAGGMASVFAMTALVRLSRNRVSPTGISIAGAATHNVAQLLVARLFTGNWAILAYLPYLLWFSLPTGALIGVVGTTLLPYLNACNQDLPSLASRPASRNARPAPTENTGRLLLLLGFATARQNRLMRLFGSRLRLRPGDTALVTALFLAGLVALIWQQGAAAPPLNPEGIVSVEGEVRMVLPLNREQMIPLEVSGGRMVLEVAPGKIRIRESTCPDKICVRTGWISNPAQAIVCVPYKTVITVRSGTATPPYDIMSR